MYSFGDLPVTALTASYRYVPPQITGPTAMTLITGYTATSTAAYTVTGNPAPTVTKTSGDPAITWNNTTFIVSGER